MTVMQMDNKVTVNTNGKSGKPGANGNDGTAYGENGKPGAHGGDGKDAAKIYLTLKPAPSTEDKVIVDVRYDHPREITIGGEDAAIILTANGGDGGIGGVGGQGARGAKGVDGYSAGEYSNAEDGGPGGPGGNGGMGGIGGNGGDGADINITVSPQDTDLLMLVSRIEFDGGKPAPGGNGGSGGAGGSGGEGGHGHRSRDLGRRLNHTDYKYGGRQGPTGKPGAAGRQGMQGINGDHGQLVIRQTDGKTYAGIYGISIDAMQVRPSGDNIFEPGEKPAVENLRFKNIGLMPTPPNHPIRVALTSNDWIAFDANNTLQLSGRIDPRKTVTLATPLFFEIKKDKANAPAIDTTFHADARLQFSAVMSRVNIPFKKIAAQEFHIQIRNPVEISTVAIPPVISSDEEAPFTVMVRNVSTQPVGLQTEHPRQLFVELSATEAEQGSLLEYHDAEEKNTQPLRAPVRMDIPLLMPGEAVKFAGTINFTGTAAAYTQAKLAVKLHLGKLENPVTEEKVVQQRNIQLQLADRYEMNQEADLVLVTNNKTSQQTIKQWQVLAQKLGVTVSIWNTSLHSGLNYYYRDAEDPLSFYKTLHDKVVVILDNEMNIGSEKLHSTDCLHIMDIAYVAKNHGISTYVIGDYFNILAAISPTTHISAGDSDISVYKKHLRGYKSDNHDKQVLLREAEKLRQDLLKRAPASQFFIVPEYNPVKQKGGNLLYNNWELGKLHVFESLPQNAAHIAARRTSGETVDDVDYFNFLKLLPLAKKLKYIDQAVDADVISKLSRAILSDLLDELHVFAAEKWNGKFNRERLAEALQSLKTLADYPFKHPENIRSTLMHYDYLASRLPDKHDRRYLPFFRRRIQLENVAHQAVSLLLKEYFPQENFAAGRKVLAETYDAVSRKELIQTFTRPYMKDGTTQFDNDIDVSNIIGMLPHATQQQAHRIFANSQRLYADKEKRWKCLEEQAVQCKFEL